MFIFLYDNLRLLITLQELQSKLEREASEGSKSAEKNNEAKKVFRLILSFSYLR